MMNCAKKDELIQELIEALESEIDYTYEPPFPSTLELLNRLKRLGYEVDFSQMNIDDEEID
jgi:hypothetical protein